MSREVFDSILPYLSLIVASIGVVITYLMYRLYKRRPNSEESGTSAGFAKILENRKSKEFSWFDKKMSNAEQDPDALPVDRAMARAWRLQKEGKIDEAIQEWHNIVKIAKGEDNDLAAHAWFSIGYLHNMEGRKEEALSAYSKAIELDENYAVAYYHRGLTKRDLGWYEFDRGNEESAFEYYESAIADYSDAIQLRRDFPEAYNDRGYTKLLMNQYEAASVDYKAAISLRPKYAYAYLGLGDVEWHGKRYKSALAHYNKAIDLERANPSIYTKRGALKTEIGRYDFARRDVRSALIEFKSALADHNKAISLNPDDAGFYLNRGNVKIEFGRYESDQDNEELAFEHYESALADYNEAIRLEPDLPAAYNNRSEVQLKLNNVEKGRKDLQTALELARQQNRVDLEISIERRILELSNME